MDHQGEVVPGGLEGPEDLPEDLGALEEDPEALEEVVLEEADLEEVVPEAHHYQEQPQPMDSPEKSLTSLTGIVQRPRSSSINGTCTVSSTLTTKLWSTR